MAAKNFTVKAKYFNGKKESTESMLRRFKRKEEKQNLLRSLKEKEFYVPKSARKNLKRKYARLRREQDLKKRAAKYGVENFDDKPVW